MSNPVQLFEQSSFCIGKYLLPVVGGYGPLHKANAIVCNGKISTIFSGFIIKLFPLVFWWSFKEKYNGKDNMPSVLSVIQSS